MSSYRIQPGEDVQHALRRIATEQIARARDALCDTDVHRAVHGVRKRCKRLRALLRLVRKGLDDTYTQENACFRDAARALSQLRDATSRIECLDALAEHGAVGIGPGVHAAVRTALAAEREQLARDLDVRARLARTDALLADAARRARQWKLDADGGAAPGVVVRSAAKTHRRAARAMRQVETLPSDENLHAWRKRVKYNRFHLALLSGIWEPVVPALRQAAETLSDQLGQHQDLVVLEPALARLSPRTASSASLEAGLEQVRRAVAARRLELQATALPLGQRLYADASRRWRRRFTRYWHAWEREQESGRIDRAPA